MAEEKRVELLRGSKKANLGEVSILKVAKANEERGINVEVNADRADQTEITKTIVKGIPAPKIEEKEEDKK